MGQLKGALHSAPIEAAHTQRRFYQPELDGLRFYAFLGVFICHTLPFDGAFYRRFHLPIPWLWGAIAKSGAAGVDLFFALSAFLITSILLTEREETGGISLRRFYLRRILRIWPLYFLLIALGVVLAHTMAKQSLPWYYVAGYLLFVGNWVHAVFGRPESICSPLWTVSIEEQFYLIWPLLMKMLRRRGMIVAAIVTFLLATVCRVGFMLAGSSGGFIYYGSVSRCDSLALGILLALFADRLPRLGRGARWLLLAGGLLGWVASSAWLNEQPGPVDVRMVLGRLIVSLAAGAILYACLHSHSKLVRGEWVVRLGKISYGLYMLHLTGILIMLSLFHPVWGWQLLATKALGFVMTVILAMASYRWVESPFLHLKDKFATVLSRPV
jgi:peptidoglycan/LPS O-acetylase OafA/YrhL